jgi:phospholipase D1/2
VLLGEHLDVPPQRVAEAVNQAGTLHGGIAALTGEGRSLRKYERLDEVSDALVAVSVVADPENPVSLDTLIEQFSPEMTLRSTRPAWVLPVVALLLAGVLTALWHLTPLARWANAEQIIGWAQDFSLIQGAPILIILAYTPASIIMFPRPLLTLLAVAAFGAWHGFAYAFIGILIAAMATYVFGTRLNRQGVRRIARGRLNRLSQVMRRRGLIAMTAVRLVPLAPFAVVNMVAGAIRIRPWHFLVGTAIGILPGTLIATIFGDQLFAGLRDPRSIDPMSVLAIVALGGLLAGATWLVRRWLFADTAEPHGRARPID